MTRRGTIAIRSTGDPTFADGVRSALRSMAPSVTVVDSRDADVLWIDGGDSPIEIDPNVRTVVSWSAGFQPNAIGGLPAVPPASCWPAAWKAAERPAGMPALLCCVGGDEPGAGVLDVGGSSTIPHLRSPRENHAERRMAKLLSRLAQGFEPPEASPVGWPMEAMIEVVRTCNLRCPLCPVGNGAAEHYDNMPVDRFREIAAILGETISSLALYNYGEPLLHPHIDEIVSIAKDASIEHVTITTNGTILRAGLESALVAAGLDSIRISIDGATQESYEKYRVGGDLEKVWANVRRLAAAKRRLGSATPRIEAQFVVNRWNEHEIEDFRRIAAEAGVDRVRLKTFNALMTGVELRDAGRDFLPMDARYLRYVDRDHLEHRDRYKLSQCDWPLVRVVVNADATIVPCCYDYNGRHPLGTFRKTSDGEWWTTPQRAQFREQLRRDPMSIDICSICPVGVPRLDVAVE